MIGLAVGLIILTILTLGEIAMFRVGDKLKLHNLGFFEELKADFILGICMILAIVSTVKQLIKQSIK